MRENIIVSRINRIIELLAQDQAICHVGGHTGHALRDFIYSIRRGTPQGSARVTPVQPGPTNPDNAPPMITSLSISRTSSTTIHATWTTDKIDDRARRRRLDDAGRTAKLPNFFSPGERFWHIAQRDIDGAVYDISGACHSGRKRRSRQLLALD
jgi:hypothetical protein